MLFCCSCGKKLTNKQAEFKNDLILSKTGDKIKIYEGKRPYCGKCKEIE